MKKFIQYFAILSLFAISLYGCAKETLTATDDGTYKSLLTFKIAQHVKSVGSEQEDEITRIDILLFKGGKLEKTMLNITSFNTTEEGYGSITISSAEEGVRDAYVIANIDDLSWISSLKVGTTTPTDILELKTAQLSSMANPPLVMSGISQNIKFSEVENSAHLSLDRAVARIDVVSSADNFTLLSARLVKAKTSAAVFEGVVFSDTPVLDFNHVETDGSKISLYTYENEQSESATSTSIEVKGDVNGIPLTYNIPLVSDETTLQIDRNYLYTVNVNNVHQNGATANISVRRWVLGEDIEEVVGGNAPVIGVQIAPEVGTFDKDTKRATILSLGGSVVVEAVANAECDVTNLPNWITVEPSTKAASIKSTFNLKVKENADKTARSKAIKFYNKLNDEAYFLTVTQEAASEPEGDKYMVVLVAGQSNAVGYDESPAYPDAAHKPNPNAFQLSYRYGTTNPSITPLTWVAENVQDMVTAATNANKLRGTKGIHLPLANELSKRIPAGYKLLFVSVAYGSSSLLSGNTSTAYDAVKMQPSIMNTPLQWGVGRPYNKTMIDRVKHALNLNPNNKFLGVVWCQGEHDATKSEAHYPAFENMTKEFFDALNNSGLGSRCPTGVADKNLWYNFSSTHYWSDWYLTSNAAPVFGGYKVWNPDTFIHVPFNTQTNAVNGNGSTTAILAAHFGNDAYTKVIAPLVAECMDNNGGLFNGNKPQKSQYKESSIRANAAALGGSLSDSDLKTGLISFFPLKGDYNSISTVTGYTIRTTPNSSFTTASDLVDINGSSVTEPVFSLSGSSILRLNGSAAMNNWTLSFMFKRTGNLTAVKQSLIYTDSNTPFIGYKKLTGINGGVAGAAEFVVEPGPSTDRSKMVAGQFMDADHVRSINDWVHYVVSYNGATKLTSVYMNGQLVSAKAMASTPAMSMSQIYIGNSSTPAVGQLRQVGLWNTVLNEKAVTKLYLYSFYGFSK